MEWLKQSLTGDLEGWSVAIVTDKGLSARMPITDGEVSLGPLAGSFAYEAVLFDADGIERHRAPIRLTGQTFTQSSVAINWV